MFRTTVSAGHQYTVDVWYKSDSRPVFFAFRPNLSSGGWSFWVRSPQLSPAPTGRMLSGRRR
jgi:hypothetical protein